MGFFRGTGIELPGVGIFFLVLLVFFGSPILLHAWQIENPNGCQDPENHDDPCCINPESIAIGECDEDDGVITGGGPTPNPCPAGVSNGYGACLIDNCVTTDPQGNFLGCFIDDPHTPHSIPSSYISIAECRSLCGLDPEPEPPCDEMIEDCSDSGGGTNPPGGDGGDEGGGGGCGNNPPVFFLTINGVNANQNSAFHNISHWLEILAPPGSQKLAIDPFHGWHQWCGAHPSKEELLVSIETTIVEWKMSNPCGKVVVIGHSMGGITSWNTSGAHCTYSLDPPLRACSPCSKFWCRSMKDTCQAIDDGIAHWPGYIDWEGRGLPHTPFGQPAANCQQIDEVRSKVLSCLNLHLPESYYFSPDGPNYREGGHCGTANMTQPDYMEEILGQLTRREPSPLSLNSDSNQESCSCPNPETGETICCPNGETFNMELGSCVPSGSYLDSFSGKAL